MFLIGLGIGLWAAKISIKEWPLILELAAIIIFIDLTIMLTPSIMKIWSAEFNYTDFIEKTIESNEKIQRNTVKKINHLSTIIQEISSFLTTDGIKNNTLDTLKEFIQQYTDEFGFKTFVFEIKGIDEQEIKNDIKISLDRISNLCNFEYPENIDTYTQALFDSDIVSIIDEEILIVPVFLNNNNTDHDILIVIKNSEGILLEIDAIHIVNLVHIFYTCVK